MGRGPSTGRRWRGNLSIETEGGNITARWNRGGAKNNVVIPWGTAYQI